MGQQLQQTAQQLGLQAPQGLPSIKQQEAQVMLSLSGEDFDKLKNHLREKPNTLVITTRTLWNEMPKNEASEFDAVMETPYFLRDETLVLLELRAGAAVAEATGEAVPTVARTPDDEAIQERHDLSSSDEDKDGADEILKEGAADAGLGRYPMLRRTFLAANGTLGLMIVPLLFSLGKFQHKERAMATTGWRKNSRLLDELGRPIKLGDLEVGGVKTVFPDVEGGRRMADSAAILIRMRPQDLKVRESRKDWVQDGHIVYSIICTHLGCPVKLYEQQTHHLFCPCHQSTFDAADSAKVLFGPAARNLPQLAIAVDDEGYFVAQGDFNEPVGPSYWERKPHYKDEVK